MKGNRVDIPEPTAPSRSRVGDDSDSGHRRRRREPRRELSSLVDGVASGLEAVQPARGPTDRQSAAVGAASGALPTTLENPLVPARRPPLRRGGRPAWLVSSVVPTTAAGLRGEKPLADGTMWVREVGKTDP